MTAPNQFERLLDLARRVVPETTPGELFDLVMTMPPELRAKAPAALEAMLYRLLDEPEPWVTRLADEWIASGDYDPIACADELLAAAARGTP